MSETIHDSVQVSNEYVTPGVAARYLHVSPKTINRWANDGLIPCIFTLGGHRRFRRQDLDTAIDQMLARGETASR